AIPEALIFQKLRNRCSKFFGIVRDQDMRFMSQIKAFNADGSGDCRRARSQSLNEFSLCARPRQKRHNRNSSSLQIRQNRRHPADHSDIRKSSRKLRDLFVESVSDDVYRMASQQRTIDESKNVFAQITNCLDVWSMLEAADANDAGPVAEGGLGPR